MCPDNLSFLTHNSMSCLHHIHSNPLNWANSAQRQSAYPYFTTVLPSNGASHIHLPICLMRCPKTGTASGRVGLLRYTRVAGDPLRDHVACNTSISMWWITQVQLQNLYNNMLPSTKSSLAVVSTSLGNPTLSLQR